MNRLLPTRLRQLKLQATFLFKAISGKEPGKLPEAATRFSCLPHYAGKTPDWLMTHAGNLKLKEAYQVLAIEYGYASWAELKHEVIRQDCLYLPAAVAFIHSWFPDYPQALSYFRKHGGYLLVFWNDYVVCGPEYIARIGLGDFETAWSKIGYNWVVPADETAFHELQEAAARNYISRQEH